MTGRHAVRLLLKRGHTVRVLAHNEDERSMRLQEFGAEVVIGDLLNLNDVRLALRGIRGQAIQAMTDANPLLKLMPVNGSCSTCEKSVPR